jgi:hypothetical protein
MSCAHRPSLEAFVASRLPLAEARAFEAHLASCAGCRTETARVRSLRSLLSGYRPCEPTALDWQRLDRKVLLAMDSAVSEPPESLLARLLPAFSLAAAAAAVLVLTFAVRTAEIAPAVAVPVSRSAALAVATESDCQVQGQSGERRALSSPVLVEGEVLQVGPGALTVQTAPATGVRLSAGSRVELAELSSHATLLRLWDGDLFAEVKPLASGDRFQVRAGDLLVSVRGTAFRVIRGAHLTRVEVLHGRVSVEREDGSAVLVTGPGSIEIEDGAPFHAEGVLGSVDAATVAAFPLGLPDRAMADLAGEAPCVVARVEPKVAAEPAPVVRKIEAPLRPVVNPRIEELAGRLQRCLADHESELEGCYEESMKREPGFSGELVLEVAVDRKGSMLSIEGRPPSRMFLGCAREIIRRCEQPGIGEDVKIEIPLALKHR